MQSALHQHAVAAQFDHFLNAAINIFKGQDVAVFRAERTIERAERAIFRAEICVVDVAVDLIRGHARIGFLPANFIGHHADADEVVGFESSSASCFEIPIRFLPLFRRHLTLRLRSQYSLIFFVGRAARENQQAYSPP